jgi:hypothetical protein
MSFEHHKGVRGNSRSTTNLLPSSPASWPGWELRTSTALAINGYKGKSSKFTVSAHRAVSHMYLVKTA